MNKEKTIIRIRNKNGTLFSNIFYGPNKNDIVFVGNPDQAYVFNSEFEANKMLYSDKGFDRCYLEYPVQTNVTREQFLSQSSIKCAKEAANEIKESIDSITNETVYFAELVEKYETALSEIIELKNEGDEWDGAALFDKAQGIAEKAMKERNEL